MIKTKVQYEDVQINLVPMIDMFLFLIIFFITSTSFSQMEREQDVVLPSNSNRMSLSREADRQLIVNVMQDGTIRFLGSPVTGQELADQLQERRERAASPLKVIVRGDRRTPYGNVASALAAVERAGVQRPYIITRLADLNE